MKIVFVGGGSFRTLPIVRGIMADPAVLAGGDIQVVDLDAGRAEVVAKLIARTPEARRSGCVVGWTDRVERALPGADVVSLVVPVGSALTNRLSEQASLAHDQVGSDQLSISGAFRSLTGGEIVRGLAKAMGKHCPRAWLLCFANPEAVYSGVVNNHTRIKALGICAGFTNHRWDLTRLFTGRDEYRDDYQVAVAGVNHLSFIVRGTVKGKDLHRALARRLADDEPVRIPGSPGYRGMVARSLWGMREAFRRHGQIIFSTEGDGLTALFPVEGLASARRHATRSSVGAIKRELAARRAERVAADAAYAAHLAGPLDDAFWAAAERSAGLAHFRPMCGDVTIDVVHALAGGRPKWLVASKPNRGAIAGFKDRTVVEHSFTLDGDRLVPDADLALSDGVHGLIGSLATHQTLLADAIATQDPRLFAEALAAYPVGQGTAANRALFRDLLKIHAAEIPAVFQRAIEWMG
jgi:alpha-galactosidase/6-phospho-beta-glucosidase family protein